jgi:hypothetical protein
VRRHLTCVPKKRQARDVPPPGDLPARPGRALHIKPKSGQSTRKAVQMRSEPERSENSRVLIIPVTGILPELQTMAFGGVETGNMNPKLARPDTRPGPGAEG